MATWPETLPNLTMTDSVDAMVQTIDTEMEAGNSLSRRITTAEIDTASITLRFTDTEISIFRNWFQDKLGANGGAAWFVGKVLLGYGVDVLKDCKIVGGYKMKHISNNWWDVSFTFKVRHA